MFGEIDSARLRAPENPWRLVALTVTVAELPLVMVSDEGLALNEKSGGGGGEVILTDTIVECDNEPPEPLTDTLYMPVGVDDMVATVRVELFEPPVGIPTLGGESEAVGPGGVTVTLRVTVLVNPLRLVRVMVEEPVLP